MDNVATILLIPAEGDPHGLLRGGPGNSRPPVVWRVGGVRVWDDALAAHDPDRRPDWPRALMLAWEGRKVPDGVARLAMRADLDLDDLFDDLDDLLAGEGILRVWLTPDGQAAGNLVLLTADGRDVSP